MPHIGHALRFAHFYWSHPYWDDIRKVGEDPWLRVIVLPSEHLQIEAQKQKTELKRRSYEYVIFESRRDEQLRRLAGVNARGWHVYFFLNVIDPKLARPAKNEDVVQTLWRVEDFDNRLPCAVLEVYEELGLMPSMIARTSVRDGVERYQVLTGWPLSEGAYPEKCSELNERSCTLLGSDRMFDSKRVFRMPGFINWKGVEDGGARVECRMVWPPYLTGDADFGVDEKIELWGYWSGDDLTEQLDKFAENPLSKILQEERKKSVGAQLEKSAASGGNGVFGKGGAGGNYGTWKQALELARKGKVSAGKGERHFALISWAGQMTREGLAVPVAQRNIVELAKIACEGGYGVGDDAGTENGRDLLNIVAAIKNFRKRDDDEAAAERREIEEGFGTDFGEFVEDIEDAERKEEAQQREERAEEQSRKGAEAPRSKDGARSDGSSGSGEDGHVGGTPGTDSKSDIRKTTAPEPSRPETSGSSNPAGASGRDEGASSAKDSPAGEESASAGRDDADSRDGGSGGNGVDGGEDVDTEHDKIRKLQAELQTLEDEQLHFTTELFSTRLFMCGGGVGGGRVREETEEEWTKWIRAVVLAKNFAADKQVGHYERWVTLMYTRLKKFYCCQGRYYSLPVKLRTSWGEDVRYMRHLGKEQGKAFLRKAVAGLSEVIFRNRTALERLFPEECAKREQIRAREEAKGAKGKPEKADDAFSVTFSARGDVMHQLVSGLEGDGSFNVVASQPGSLIVFQNGIFDLDTRTFTADESARLRMPHVMLTRFVEGRNGALATPAFDAFLNDAFPQDEATWRLIYCLIGYCMTSDNPLQKVFALSGVSGSGKSTLAGVIFALCGVHNAVALNYSSLGKDTGLGVCEGKSLAVVEEAEAVERKIHQEAFASIKKATSGEPVSVRNLYSDPRTIRLGTKFLLLTNKDFAFDDAGGAASRRIVPIQFDYAKPLEERVLRMREAILGEARAIATKAALELGERWALGEGVFNIAGSKALEAGRAVLQEAIAPLRDTLSKVVERLEPEVRSGNVKVHNGSMAPAALLVGVLRAIEAKTERRLLVRGRPETLLKIEMSSLGFDYVDHAEYLPGERNALGGRVRFRGYRAARISFEALLESFGVTRTDVFEQVRTDEAAKRLLKDIYNITGYFDDSPGSADESFRL